MCSISRPSRPSKRWQDGLARTEVCRAADADHSPCICCSGFCHGLLLSSFQMMFLIYSAGVVLTMLITVPNWPFFNHHPLKWLNPVDAKHHPKPQPMTSKKKPTKHYLK
ncbi:hypothetical protein HHK36_007465 [Tetracentron sinense]|uniref:Signal peptidase complex subunit 1 n=1 Tax=Tetracentron sinense TaxID=13715 RepID=A0A835DLT7_TETSI|nr:hypothetical protein HHK36_007465 [Tetracentron sinense]